jgi:hypothetical protein
MPHDVHTFTRLFVWIAAWLASSKKLLSLSLNGFVRVHNP